MIDKNFLLEQMKEIAYQECIRLGYSPRFSKVWCEQSIKNGYFEECLMKRLKGANVKI